MATADDVPELERIYSTVNDVWERLTVLDVRSGAVGAARRLLDKLEGAIDYLEKHGDGWDGNERLARNAWRVAEAAARGGGSIPAVSAWDDLPESVRIPWRSAALQFRDRTDP